MNYGSRSIPIRARARVAAMARMNLRRLTFKNSQCCAKAQKRGLRIELHKSNKILERTIKKKDGRPKFIKSFKKEPKPTNGQALELMKRRGEENPSLPRSKNNWGARENDWVRIPGNSQKARDPQDM